MCFSELTEAKKISYVEEVKRRGSFFRQVQIWPLSDTFDFEGWLDNFVGVDESYIAARMLSSFMYFPSKMIDRMLYDVIGREVSRIALKERNSSSDFYKTEICYSYLPGDDGGAVDSGQLFLRRVRDKLHVPQKNVIAWNDLLCKCGSATPYRNIIFCDDVIGSGQQCINALSKRRRELDMSLYEYAKTYQFSISIIPVVANVLGVENVRRTLPGIQVQPLHALGSEYNLFNADSVCWNGDMGLYERAMELIRAKSEDLGIRDNGDVVSMRGYENQGWTLAFEHGIPDAVPAIFFYSEKGWNPLMWRTYERRVD